MKAQILHLFALAVFVGCGATAHAGKAPVAAVDQRTVDALDASATNPGVVSPPPAGISKTQTNLGAVRFGDFEMWPGGFMANPAYVMMAPFFPLVMYTTGEREI